MCREKKVEYLLVGREDRTQLHVKFPSLPFEGERGEIYPVGLKGGEEKKRNGGGGGERGGLG